MQNIKPRDYFLEIEQQLAKYYDLAEANSLTTILLDEILGIDRAKLIINDKVSPDPRLQATLNNAIDQLKSYVPIQYILGKAPFFGREFWVDPSVLIPRPETEELVDWIIKENGSSSKRILDIGTGSGCIPITIEKETGCTTFGIDICVDALQVAARNKESLEVNTNFIHLDILMDKLEVTGLDVIVSNPPYILEKEKEEMAHNVLHHEPGLALFVPDDRPLLFYEEIANIGFRHLNKGGYLYFEINEAFSKEVCTLLEDTGFEEIQIKKDLNGKNRMARALKR